MKKLEQFIDNLGLKYFKGSEFTSYWSQVRKGVKNSPPPEKYWNNIVETIIVLDKLREELGLPIQITSSYRSPEYNKSVGGAKFSQHLVFNAIDFQTKIATPKEVVEKLKSFRGKRFYNPFTKTKFTFRGGIGLYPTFVHLDTRGHDADW